MLFLSTVAHLNVIMLIYSEEFHGKLCALFSLVIRVCEHLLAINDCLLYCRAHFAINDILMAD